MIAKEVFYIADDFGMSPEINEAIIFAFRRGVLTGSSLMMGQPGTDEAVALARQIPELHIGFHWHLNDSRPMTLDHWPWGRSPVGAGIWTGLSRSKRQLVLQELEVQWEAFQATGLPCRFANSHHHLHIHPFLLGPFLETVSLPDDGWFRLGDPRRFDHPDSDRFARFPGRLKHWGLGRRPHPPSSDTLWGIDRPFRMQSNEVKKILSALPPGRHEFFFHPRSVDLGNDADTRCLIELKGWGVS